MPTFVFSINRDESVDPHCHPESNQSICCVILRAAVACARLTLCPANCEAQAKRRWGREGAASEFGARQKVAAQTAAAQPRPGQSSKTRIDKEWT
jgi:hypothetical protein